jgi:hypothetical protein
VYATNCRAGTNHSRQAGHCSPGLPLREGQAVLNCTLRSEPGRRARPALLDGRSDRLNGPVAQGHRHHPVSRFLTQAAAGSNSLYRFSGKTPARAQSSLAPARKKPTPARLSIQPFTPFRPALAIQIPAYFSTAAAAGPKSRHNRKRRPTWGRPPGAAEFPGASAGAWPRKPPRSRSFCQPRPRHSLT